MNSPAATIFILFLSATCLCPSAWAAKAVTLMDLDGGGDVNLASLAKALPAMALGDLAAVGGLTVVDRQNLRQVLKELSLGESGLVDDQTAPKLGALVGAQLMVVGSLFNLSGQLTLTWKLVRTATGTVVGGTTVTGDENKPISLKKTWVRAIYEVLKREVDGLSALPETADDMTAPSEVRSFGQALSVADRGEDQKAQAILKDLAARRPGFTYARNELGQLERRLLILERDREKAITDRTGEKATDYNGFMTATSVLMSSAKYTKLLSYVRRYQGQFPPSPAVSPMTTGEMGLYYEALALYMLKRHDEALPLYEAFLKAYPASMYGASVKMYLVQSMQYLKTRTPKKNRIEGEIAEEFEKAKAGGPEDKAWAQYMAGIKWMGGEFYKEALDSFRKIPLSSLKTKYGTDGDTLLYNRFQCEYYLAQKEEGLRTQKTLETLYPESSMIPAVASMAAMFPE